MAISDLGLRKCGTDQHFLTFDTKDYITGMGGTL